MSEEIRDSVAVNFKVGKALLARASARASELGLSRAEFFRSALLRECERVEQVEARRLRLERQRAGGT